MVSRDLFLPVSAQPSIEDQVEYGVRAEDLGYDRVWVAETWGRDAVTVLATIGARTSDIGVGTSISSVFSRSPALLGQTAATMQEVTGGRFRLGVGQSAPPFNEMWHGVAHDRPFRRMREAIEVIRAVLSGDVLEYDGELFDLSGFRLRFDPPSPPPPVDAAAMGPKAMELAGRFADGVHTTMVSPSGFAESLEHFERGLKLGDRSRETVRVMVGCPACALEDGEAARDRVRHHLAFYVGSMARAYHDHLARQGYEEAADDIVALWMGGDQEAAEAVITDAMLDELAIAGTPETARRRLRAWESVEGVDAVVPVLPVHTSVEENQATMEALAP